MRRTPAPTTQLQLVRPVVHSTAFWETRPNYSRVEAFKDAVGEYEVAQEIDPLSLQLYVDLGAALYMMRSYDGSLRQLRKALELEPSYYPARYAVAWVHVQKAEYHAAREELRLLFREEAHLARGLLGYDCARSGNLKEA
jgi:tetratricopeptide (TPR) repeat protein